MNRGSRAARTPRAVGGARWRAVRPAAALLLLTTATFGVLVPRLGFYWDDWQFVLSHDVAGGAGVRAFFSSDRPAAGWWASLWSELLGARPLAWHMLALVSIWFVGLGVLATLRSAWPERRNEAFLAAALAVVYPGFTGQPVSVIYSQGPLLQLAFLLFSVAASLQAQRARTRRSARLLTAGALALLVLSLPAERYLALELVRFVLLFFAVGEANDSVRTRLATAARRWAPYGVVVASFVLWRFAIFQPTRPAVEQGSVFHSLLTDPGALGRIPLHLISDVLEAGFLAWTLPWDPTRRVADGAAMLLVAAGAALAFAVLALGLRLAREWLRRSDRDGATDRSWRRQALGAGAIGLVAGGIPTWFIDKELLLAGFRDRHSLPMVLGVVLCLVASLETILRREAHVVAVVGALLAVSFAYHVDNGRRFRSDWDRQTAFVTQVSQRVPAFEPNTAVIVDGRSFLSREGYAIAGPLLVTYGASRHAPDIVPDFWVFDLSYQFESRIASLVPTRDLRWRGRNITFRAPPGRVVALHYAPPGCVRVLDPERGEIPGLDDAEQLALLRSDPGLIDVSARPARPPDEIFPRAGGNAWCSLFEAADLAAQTGDWRQVMRLGDRAIARGLTAGESSEWLVFAEGFLRRGASGRATRALQSAARDRKVWASECRLLARVRPLATKLADRVITKFNHRLGCTPR